MAQAIDEAIVHGIVHDVGNSQFLSSLLHLGNLRLGILCNDGFGGIALDGLIAVEHDATARILLRKASGTTNGLHTAIGTGCGDIVLQQNTLALNGTDERVVDAHIMRHICGWSERHEVIESVAPMYMQ